MKMVPRLSWVIGRARFESWVVYPFHLGQAFISHHLLTRILRECRDKVQVTDALPGALKAAVDDPFDGFSHTPPPRPPSLTEQGKDANKTT